jgi:hypothetical protein
MANLVHGGSLPTPTDHSQCGSSAAPESPVPQDRPGGPIGGHKILESSAGQPQDVGTSLRHNTNKRCNAQEAFPPSLDDDNLFWSVAKREESDELQRGVTDRRPP